MSDVAVESGWTFVSPARTVAEADIVQYAGLCGDWMPAHVDREAAQSGIFGARVAHGPFVLALAIGLLSRVPAFHDRYARTRALTTTARSPVYIGDTVYARARVREQTDDSSVLDIELLTRAGRMTTQATVTFAHAAEGSPPPGRVPPSTQREGSGTPPSPRRDLAPAAGSCLYFEDMQIGDRYMTGRKTVTAGDLERFVSLVGDWRPQYVDADRPDFGAHELYLYCLTFGLRVRTNLFNDSGVAFLGADWSFVDDVHPGDTVRSVLEVADKRTTRHADRGLVVQRVQVLDQRDRVLQAGTHTAFYRIRNGA